MVIMAPKGRTTLSMLIPYELNCEELICTRYLNRYDRKSIEIIIGLDALWD